MSDQTSTAITEWPDNMPLEDQVERLASLLLTRFGGPTRSEGAIEMAFRLLNEQADHIEYLNWCMDHAVDLFEHGRQYDAEATLRTALQNGS